MRRSQKHKQPRPCADLTILAARFYPDSHGGVETHLNAFARELADQGLRIDVWSQNRTKSPEDETLGANLTIWRRPTMDPGRLWRWREWVDLYWWRKRLFERPPAGLIWASDPIIASAVILAGMRKQLIYNPAGCCAAMRRIAQRYPHIMSMNMSRSLIRMDRFAYGHSPRMIVSSQNVIDQYRRCHGSKRRGSIHAAPLGVKPAASLPDPTEARRRWRIGPRAFVIGFVGRLDTCKQLDFLFEAMAQADLQPDARLLIVGEGPDQARLIARARQLGVAQRLIWTGGLNYPADAYTAMDVMVLPSVYEAFGLVLIEAMSAGVGVIARRGDGETIMTATDEIIRHGETGLIADSHDTTDLADHLQTLSRDRAFCARLGRTAREHAAGQTWTAYAKQCTRMLFESSTDSENTTMPDQPRDAWADQPTLDQLAGYDIFHLRADFLKRLFKDVDGLNVLEAGSGPAHDSLSFAKRGARITALDCSETALQLAQRFYHSLNLPLTVQLGDLRKLPFDDNQFDIVYNAGVLEHFTDSQLEQVIDEMIRVAKPGGVVLAFCPNRYNFFYQHHLKRIASHSYDFERSFTANELRQRFEARGLSQVQLSGVHVHPAPNYLLPAWLPKHHRIEPFFRALFSPLEKCRGLDRFKSLIGQDFVLWATVPEKITDRADLTAFSGGPAVRNHPTSARRAA